VPAKNNVWLNECSFLSRPQRVSFKLQSDLFGA